jgi:hypothetical protein
MRKIAGVVIAFLFAAGMARAEDALNCKLVPGWEQSEPVRQYTAGSLYDYKDGGAEGYLIFGFAAMRSLTCKSGADMLAIDISEMTDADAAYGIFATNRDPAQPVAKIGMGGQVQPQSASFAKGKYYVELVVTAASTESNYRTALQAFATRIAERLDGRDTAPEALDWFPKENSVSVRLIPESVLGLRLLKRGYVAKYKQGQAFIVLETTPESAAGVLQKLREHFDGAIPAEAGDEAFQARAQYLDGICIFRKGRYLAGYANLPDPKQAVILAAQLAARIP